MHTTEISLKNTLIYIITLTPLGYITEPNADNFNYAMRAT